VCFLLTTFAHAAAGASGARHSLRPLKRGRNEQDKTRAHCVAGMRKCVSPLRRDDDERASCKVRRVGKANGSRERAPDDRLRVPTSQSLIHCLNNGGHGASAPLPTLRFRNQNEKLNPPPCRSGFRRAARRSAAGPSWFRCARRSSRCRHPSPAPPRPCGGSSRPCRRA
jgi:hypothetical protein